MYSIDNINEKFETLREAKWHLQFAYTNEERKKYFHNDSHHYIWNDKDGKVASYTRIMVDDEGNVRFQKTVKF